MRTRKILTVPHRDVQLIRMHEPPPDQPQIVHGLGCSWLRLPDGRQLRGYPEGHDRGPISELKARNALARQQRGLVEVSMAVGRADVATPTDVYEVECFSTWRSGLRQVLAYAACCGLRPNLALVEVPPSGALTVFAFLRKNLPGVRLHIYDRGSWRAVTSMRAASLKVVA